MNLYYKDVNLGEIKDNYVVDGMWLYGEIFPNDNLEIFREFLKLWLMKIMTSKKIIMTKTG